MSSFAKLSQVTELSLVQIIYIYIRIRLKGITFSGPHFSFFHKLYGFHDRSVCKRNIRLQTIMTYTFSARSKNSAKQFFLNTTLFRMFTHNIIQFLNCF